MRFSQVASYHQLLVAASVCLLPAAAHSTTYVVDPSGPLTSIQDAVNLAADGDTVLVNAGTYVEQVQIAPPAADSLAFELVLLAEINGNPVVVKHTESTQYTRAAVEIYNNYDVQGAPQTRCRDMRITVRGFEIRGLAQAGAIAVKHCTADTTQRYLTGLFIEDNYLESAGWADAIYVGDKISETYGLYYQPLKWGHFLNNEVVVVDNEDAAADAMSAWHFVGTVANNRMNGFSEGTHLGLARSDSRHPSFVPDTTYVEHNLYYCNVQQMGIHFAHGSFGYVRNNLVIRNDSDGIPASHGIHIGTPTKQVATEPICQVDSTECIDTVDAEGDHIPVRAWVWNNTISTINGPGLFASKDSKTDFYGNIVHQTAFQASTLAALEIQGYWNFAQYGAPSGWDSDYNLLDGNLVDYEHSSLAGDHDRNSTTGNNSARFQGIIDVGPGVRDSVSFMLKASSGTSPCYPLTQGVHSDAIDAGYPGINRYDHTGGPGLGAATCDAGAYGGPFNVWDLTGVDPCLEYVQGVGTCGQ